MTSVSGPPGPPFGGCHGSYEPIPLQADHAFHSPKVGVSSIQDLRVHAGSESWAWAEQTLNRVPAHTAAAAWTRKRVVCIASPSPPSLHTAAGTLPSAHSSADLAFSYGQPPAYRWR